MSTTCDLAIKIFLSIFYFLIFIRFFAKQLRPFGRLEYHQTDMMGLLRKKSTRKSNKKIFQKWTSSTCDSCDFAIKIFRRIFYFLIFIRFTFPRFANSDRWFLRSNYELRSTEGCPKNPLECSRDGILPVSP